MTQVPDRGSEQPGFSDPSLFTNPETNQRRTIAAIVDRAMKFGKDVTIDPDGGEIAIRRVRQFARIVPQQGGRVILAMKLPLAIANARLSESLPVDRSLLTHNVSLTGPSDFDRDVESWLMTAYDQDGERRQATRDDD